MNRDKDAKEFRMINPEEMTREVAEEMGLCPGRRIKWSRGTMAAEDAEEGGKRVRTGVVTDLYTHIFRVAWDDAAYKECFQYRLLLRTEGEHIRMLGGGK